MWPMGSGIVCALPVISASEGSGSELLYHQIRIRLLSEMLSHGDVISAPSVVHPPIIHLIHT